MELLEIDHRGLDEMDKRILSLMAQNYEGGRVGLGTLAVGVGEEEHTLEEVHEPFLFRGIFRTRASTNKYRMEVTGSEPKDGSDNSQLSLL